MLAVVEYSLISKKFLIELFYIAFPFALNGFHFSIDSLYFCNSDEYFIVVVVGCFRLWSFGNLLDVVILPHFALQLYHFEVELTVLLFSFGP